MECALPFITALASLSFGSLAWFSKWTRVTLKFFTKHSRALDLCGSYLVPSALPGLTTSMPMASPSACKHSSVSPSIQPAEALIWCRQALTASVNEPCTTLVKLRDTVVSAWLLHQAHIPQTNKYGIKDALAVGMSTTDWRVCHLSHMSRRASPGLSQSSRHCNQTWQRRRLCVLVSPPGRPS